MSAVINPKGPRWRGYLVTKTALIHGGADRVGNVVPFNTEPVHVPGRGRIAVPTVSGNSIRHGLRECLAHLYLNLLKPIRVPPKLYYVLFSGGANQGGDGGHFDFDDRREVMEMIPPVAVFGTARDGGTFAGAVGVSSAQPACRETWDLIAPPRPTDEWPCGAAAADALAERVWCQKNTSALRMLGEQQNTRTDALRVRSPDFVLPDDADGGESVDGEDGGAKGKGAAKKGKRGKKDGPGPHQMIFSAQTLVRGVALAHELCFLQPANDLTRATFGAALEQWLLNPILGGRSALGHGGVEATYDRPFPDPEPFRAHMAAKREQIRAYLRDKWGAALDEG